MVLTTDVENLNVGDMLLRNGDRVVHNDLAEEVRQRLIVAFSFFQGEWFLNLDDGTPWLSVIGEKGAEDDLRYLCTAVVAGTEGVAEIDSLTVTQGTRRNYEINFQCTLTTGENFSFGAFVIAPP